jgi:hypothetical protein
VFSAHFHCRVTSAIGKRPFPFTVPLLVRSMID